MQAPASGLPHLQSIIARRPARLLAPHCRRTLPPRETAARLCTHDRAAGLNQPAAAAAIKEQIRALEDDGAFTLQAAVIMPDHLHLLGIVTGRLSVGQIVGRLKTKTRPALLAVGLHWQGNFFEHRLRPDDRSEDVLRYLFLNPYRARVLPPTGIYPWFWLGPVESAWFRPTLDDDRPFPAWLA